jgi:hypothetical protein
VEHWYGNDGPEPARFILTVLEPGVGSGAPTEVTDD